MPTSVTVTLRISVEIDDEYQPSDHIENIFEVTQYTFPVASVELVGSDVSSLAEPAREHR